MATKTALITGTSTGIGAASVARQAEAGWRVYAGVPARAFRPVPDDQLLDNQGWDDD